jgi:hypothetical protein
MITVGTKDSPVKDIRQHILHILHTLATPNLRTDSFRSLLGHSISCKDLLQVHDLLSFLRVLAVSPDTPFHSLEGVWYWFSTLHHLINNEDEGIVVSVMDLFASLHFLDFLPEPKFHYHVDFLMDCGSSATMTDRFFRAMLPMVKKYPELLPFSFFAVKPDKRDFIEDVMQELRPDTKFSEPKNWSLVPLLAAFRIGGDFEQFVVNFIAESSSGDWQDIVTEIDLIGLVYNIEERAEQVASSFLNASCQTILKTPAMLTFEILHGFFDIAIFFVFFHRQRMLTRALQAAVAGSPFSDSNPSEALDSSPVFEKEDFYSALTRLALSSSYRYGVRIAADGH